MPGPSDKKKTKKQTGSRTPSELVGELRALAVADDSEQLTQHLRASEAHMSTWTAEERDQCLSDVPVKEVPLAWISLLYLKLALVDPKSTGTKKAKKGKGKGPAQSSKTETDASSGESALDTLSSTDKPTASLRADESPDTFLEQVAQLVANASTDAVQHEYIKFSTIVRVYVDVSIETGNAMNAVVHVRQALQKATIAPGHLTRVHGDLARVCLIAKTYRVAADVFDQDIYKVEPKTSGVDALDTLLYFYYGGMIYTGLKEFERAISFFQTAFTIPSEALSSVMIEAYKKWMLVSLITSGAAPTPRYLPNTTERVFKGLADPYFQVSRAFENHSLEDVQKALEKFAELFAREGNIGLVKQAHAALIRRNIARHTSTYVTLSLEDVGTSVGVSAEEAERLLLRMIANDEVSARLDQENRMVAFTQPILGGQSRDALSEELVNVIDRVMDLNEKIKSADRELSLSEEYLAKRARAEVRQSRKWGGVVGSTAAGDEEAQIAAALAASLESH